MCIYIYIKLYNILYIHIYSFFTIVCCLCSLYIPLISCTACRHCPGRGAFLEHRDLRVREVALVSRAWSDGWVSIFSRVSILSISKSIWKSGVGVDPLLSGFDHQMEVSVLSLEYPISSKSWMTMT